MPVVPGRRLAVAADTSHLIILPLISVGHWDLEEKESGAVP